MFPGLSQILVRSLAILPDGLLAQAGRGVRLSRGHGWGAATVHQEVAAALGVIDKASGDRFVAFDVGANKGEWSWELLRSVPSATVFASEPSSAAHRVLAAGAAHFTNMTVVQAAVGAIPGTATLWSESPGSGLASLTRRRLDHFGIHFGVAEEVDVISLDQWCDSQGIWPDLLKLDVEGHELDVLKGAQAVLPRVRVLQFEFGGCNIDTRCFFQDFFYLLTDAGFSLHRLGPRGLTPVPAYQEADECFETTNYFAIRHTAATNATRLT